MGSGPIEGDESRTQRALSSEQGSRNGAAQTKASMLLSTKRNSLELIADVEGSAREEEEEGDGRMVSGSD